MAEMNPLQYLRAKQQRLLKRLHVFIDSLRAIKKDSDVSELSYSIESSIETLMFEIKDDIKNIKLVEWKYTFGILFILQQLQQTMIEMDAIEIQNSNNCSINKQDQVRKAPSTLLSLRDFSVLQACIEILYCWSIYPRVKAGILLPLNKRQPTRTLNISSTVLTYRSSLIPLQCNQDSSNELLLVLKGVWNVLQLPQFTAILLPKYINDIVAVTLYTQVCPSFKADIFQQLQEEILEKLTLSMKMKAVRSALSQSSKVSAASSGVINTDKIVQNFRKICGKLLSEWLITDGGIVATIEMLLGQVDASNSQARLYVTSLLMQCPQSITRDKYYSILAHQTTKILLENDHHTVVKETTVLLISQLADVVGEKQFKADILHQVFYPLMVYDGIKKVDNADSGNIDISEEVLQLALDQLDLFTKGPSLTPTCWKFMSTSIFRPLIHLYSFASQSKSHLKSQVQNQLLQFLDKAPDVVQLLQNAVVPTHNKLLLYLKFSAGGSGGIALKSQDSKTMENMDQDDFLESKLMEISADLVNLMGSKEFTAIPSTSSTISHLFVSLLKTYIQIQIPKSTNNEIDAQANSQLSSIRDVKLILSLLLMLIERLDMALLREPITILQCIATVLQGFVKHFEDPKMHNLMDVNDQDRHSHGNQEFTTICLGLLLAIVENGSETRSLKEEEILISMLSDLEVLSQNSRVEIAELASDTRLRILTRGNSKSDSSTKTHQHIKVHATWKEQMQGIQEDLSSSSVPIRAKGIVTLTKLVRRITLKHQKLRYSQRSTRIQVVGEETENMLESSQINQLFDILITHLNDHESYVYLAAVHGLAALAEVTPATGIPMLLKSFQNSELPLDTRLKLSEALLFTAKKSGEMLSHYAPTIAYAYLHTLDVRGQKNTLSNSAIKDGEKELLALHVSCLSNLAEVCAILKWSIAPFINDVVICVLRILETTASVGKPVDDLICEVRRASVFLLQLMVRSLGWKVLELIPEHLTPIFRRLTYIKSNDADKVTSFHATLALDEINIVMRQEIFPSDEQYNYPELRSKLRFLP